MLRGSDIRRLAAACDRQAARHGHPVVRVEFWVHPDGWRVHLTACPGVALARGEFVPATMPVACDTTRLRGRQRYTDTVRSVTRRLCPVTRDVPIRIVQVRRP